MFTSLNRLYEMAIVYLLLFTCCLLQWSGVGSAFTPVVYPGNILPSSSQCGQSNLFEDQQLLEALKLVQQQLPPPGCNPPLTTCKHILHCNSSPSSGYYKIQAANGSVIQVYCNMEGTNCGGKGGWMRVAHLNMTDPSSQCPTNFTVHSANNKRFCIRNTNTSGCRAMLFEAFHSYTQVCGYVRGYSYYTVDVFGHREPNQPLDGNYVDGVSITYDTPPSHIWTYAAGYSERGSFHYDCPCNTNVNMLNVPSYVGSDYYCESGNTLTYSQPTWYTNDPLWDGDGCGGMEGPCCNHTGLPWFNKNILTPTTASIKVRLCVDQATFDENIGIERLELYVK